MASTNLKQSSLRAIVVTGATFAFITGIGLWFLVRSGAQLHYITAFATACFFGLLLVVALNCRARQRWLNALNHDTDALTRLTTAEPVPIDSGTMLTTELRPLSEKVLQERRKLLNLGLTDPLCNVGNRRALEYWLRALHSDPRTRAPIALMLIDIDYFKKINDQHGHKVGDRVIFEFAQHLKRRIRRGDLVARLGGDEFCVVFPNTRLNLATSLARRIRAQLPASFELQRNIHHPLTWTGGVSVSDPFDASFDQVLWRADDALIRAKAAGRDRIHVCPAQPGSPDQTQAKIHTRLH